MAGVGFTLRKLLHQDTFCGPLRAMFHCTFIAAGPWLISVAAMGIIMAASGEAVAKGNLIQFQLIVMYNFAFSMVLASPVSITLTRFVADSIYLKKLFRIPGALLGGLVLTLLLTAPFAIWLYGFYLDLPLIESTQ